MNDAAVATDELAARCHCGQCTLKLSRRPDYINQCNCSMCTALGWRCAYFASDEIGVSGTFDSYVRKDLRQSALAVLRCSTCGTPTHWRPLGDRPHDRLGVNANLLPQYAVEGVEVRHIDGASWEE